MRFRNREHAAHLLVEKLTAYHGENPLVLAIPRGAVPMGKITADALGEEITAAEWIAAVSACYRFRDLPIEEPEIESIVRRIYEEGL